MGEPIVGLKTIGDKLLQLRLNQLGKIYSPRAPQRVIKAALKKGGAVILKEAKRRAPKSKSGSRKDRPPGNLRRSMMVSKGRRLRKYPSGNLLAILGPQWPLGAHGTIVERGTARRQTSGGADRGKMPAIPFLEPAFAGKQKEVLKALREEIKKGLEREWAKWKTRQG